MPFSFIAVSLSNFPVFNFNLLIASSPGKKNKLFEKLYTTSSFLFSLVKYFSINSL
jgi:hypothetical protein